MALPQESFALAGYEHLEMSTQIVIAESLARGIFVEVLDPHNNFLRLTKNSKVEYIKDATKTSKDNYISYLIMENKQVSKQILQEDGLSVPDGKQFFDINSALAYYPDITTKSMVVKPNMTNFGIGISFLEPEFSHDDYQQAIEFAFQFDTTIIVERFISGGEHRFLVVDYKTQAVCHRVPANIVGDGKQTIADLVKVKNQDPRRGEDHHLPLEKLQLTDVEDNKLGRQGLQVTSIPAAGEQIFIRRNSNISTGGDSIDSTDSVHPDYKKIAEQAARLVNAKITGVDMLIDDISSPPSPDNYSIIEINFNPVLYIHNYPFKGKNREVGKAVIDLLGF